MNQVGRAEAAAASPWPRPAASANGVFSAATAALLLLYVAHVYAHLAVPELGFGLIGAVVVGMGLAISPRKAPFYFSAAFLLAGTGLAAGRGVSAGATLASVAEFRSLVGVIVLIPVVGFIFELRNYGAALLALAGRWTRGERGMVSALGVLASLVAAMTSVASLVVVYGLLRAQVRDQERWSRLLSTATLRGFGSANVWAPSAPVISIALLFTGATFEQFLPIAFGLGVLCILLHAGFCMLERGEPRWQPQASEMPQGTAAWQSAQFLLLLLAFFGTLLVVERASGLALINIVPIVCLGFAGVVFALSGRPGLFARRLGGYFASGVPGKSSEITLILSAGYLIGVLRLSGLGEQFAQAFEQALGGVPLLLMAAMPSLMVGLSLVGVPPMVTLLLLAGTLDQASLASNPAVFAAALSLGVATGSMLSPFAIPVFLLASVVGRPTTRVALAWNWTFALTYFGLGLGVLAVLMR